MSAPFRTGISVVYAGARWQVLHVLDAETVLLRSDTGQELAADPMRIRLPDSPTLKATSSRPVDELRYDEAERAAAVRRRDLLLGLANRPRTTAEVTATAEALGLTPRGVWALLQRMASAGTESRSSCRPVTPLARRVPNARAEAITQQAIDQHFARRTRASQQSRRRDRRALPGRRLCGTVCKTIRARVRARDQFWLRRRREGWGKARSLGSPARIPAPQRPGRGRRLTARPATLAGVTVPAWSDSVTDHAQEYITELASGALRGANPMNAADRLYAVTLEAWRHREAFARWKARARRQRRGTTRRKVRPYATASLP